LDIIEAKGDESGDDNWSYKTTMSSSDVWTFIYHP